ncbi:MAG TPA: DUF2244 domain-containing protein [Caulobacteraceae bacterium]|nr:DUF2244 domain-containing protein [Caulobacteraceae bacterium]
MSTGALYMDAVITPNRSLSQRGIVVIVVAMGVMSLIPMTFAIILGAPFPPMFLGLDVLGVWLALRIATRRKTAPERVLVSSEAVRVLMGEKPVWSSPTAFTRVDVEGEGDELRVWLRLSRKSLAVAQALSPGERGEFADALKDAVRDARAERHPS